VIPPATPEELETCPFDAGREDRTPPETLRLPADGAWQVRVVPNLYPAFERQEVVVHVPQHARSVAELSDDEVALVAEAWQRRRHAHPERYLHALVNEGREAGSSLPHTHSQLVWLDGFPPEVGAELALAGERCALCDLARSDDLALDERDGVVSRVAWAGRLPYELLVAPLEHELDPWTSARLGAALILVAQGLRRLRAVEGPCPANVWLHAAEHWHLHVVPRLTVLAGLELGAGIYVNTLRPEAAAQALRSVAPG
jgi:UDPglucose--hexose-1-phosphate uridylyltransferase